MKFYFALTLVAMTTGNASAAEDTTNVFCATKNGSSWHWLQKNGMKVKIRGKWGKQSKPNGLSYNFFSISESNYNLLDEQCKLHFTQDYIPQPADSYTSKWHVFQVLRPSGDSYIAPGEYTINPPACYLANTLIPTKCKESDITKPSFESVAVFCANPDGSYRERLTDHNGAVTIIGKWNKHFISNGSYFNYFSVHEIDYQIINNKCPEGLSAQPVSNDPSTWNIFKVTKLSGERFFTTGKYNIIESNSARELYRVLREM